MGATETDSARVACRVPRPPAPNTAGTETRASTEAHARGDVVSEYPYLILPFAAFNLVGWTLALLEVGNTGSHMVPWCTRPPHRAGTTFPSAHC